MTRNLMTRIRSLIEEIQLNPSLFSTTYNFDLVY